MNENQNKKMSAFSFKVMSFLFKIRDFFSNPMKKVEKAQIREGDIVVDYGCGPGSYSIAASKKVGAEGKVYALDVLPVAIKMVQKKVTKKNINNIITVKTDCKIDLPDNSVDKILFLDVLAMVRGDNLCIIKEFHRVLKQNGILSMDDHHSSEEEILKIITKDNLFTLRERIGETFNFSPEKN